MANKLSDPMLSVLRNLAAGCDPGTGLAGRSAYGGLTWTVVALYKRGLIDAHREITDAGREAVKEHDHG